MKYAVDRIENDIAILEDLETKKRIEIPLSELPINLREGSILTYENDQYVLDFQEEQERRNKIKNKFERLRKK